MNPLDGAADIIDNEALAGSWCGDAAGSDGEESADLSSSLSHGTELEAVGTS